MSPHSPRSEAEDHLLNVLGMVNEWLRFAEAKNGGLIALAGLALTGLLSFAGQVDTFFLGAAILMVVGTALWLGSIMLAIFSFKPRTSNVVPDARLRDLVEDTDNLFYFKHLAAYSSETLLTALGVDLESQGHRARFERNLADQVIANSRITVQKLDLFDSAIRWWVAGTLIVSAGVLWSFVGRT